MEQTHPADSMIVLRNGVWVRPHMLRETCDCLMLHCHPYDHLTRCIEGRARLELWRDDNRNERISSAEFGPSDEALNVPAGVYHEWKALEPGTVVECEVPSGELQRYEGVA